jgi:23S rRNA pseudouridine2605 synthase
MAAERLQKIIAAAGIASRRKAEELIAAGAVSVNGQIVTELGTKADAETDHIRVNGKLLKGPQRHTYLMMNKPKGYVTTVSDPEGRPTVMDLVRSAGVRVYPVGRLDYASEGLLLLTNDGDLAHKLTHASSHVPKTYVVKVSGVPTEEAIEELRGGVFIREEDGGRKVRTAPAKIALVKPGDNPWYEVTLIEGRNRQIRKMFETVGHHVEKIRRVRYGPLHLDVEPGKLRPLDAREVEQLKSAAEGRRAKPAGKLTSRARTSRPKPTSKTKPPTKN